MGKKRKLRKMMGKRGFEATPVLAVCVGKKCAEREASRAVVSQTREHVAKLHLPVRVEMLGCLHVCEEGPIAATYPKIKFHRHVDGVRACALVDKLARELAEE